MNVSIWHRAKDALSLRYRRSAVGIYGAGLGGDDDEAESGPWIPTPRRDLAPEAAPARSATGRR